MTKKLSWRTNVTTWRMLTWSVAAGLVLSGASATAGGRHSGERHYHYRDLISGTAAPSSFDFNGDSVPGHSVTFAGQSSLGPVHGALMVEYDFISVGPDPECPADKPVKLPVVVSAGTRALTGTDGQIFMRDDETSALYCLDPFVTGAFTMSVKGTVTGGMGRFAGATGTYEYTGSGQVLLQDNSMLPFGGFVLETRGSFTVPAH
jgi:hypothetical protein